MYIDRCVTKRDGNEYVRYLLRESFRENGRVKKRTIANLSECKKEEIEAMMLALKHKEDLTQLGVTKNSVQVIQGVSIGAVWVVHQVAKELGIIDALGKDRDGKLALWQVIARIIDQGSRLSASRLANAHACAEVVGVSGFNEDSLYYNLDWIAEQQTCIEDNLFKKYYSNSKPSLYLYDVTSSYFEGWHNELAAFGYNRDGKKGKKQIVVGLVCDEKGEPFSIQVFKGNTPDLNTFEEQVKKVKERFGASNVTFVGDRGMIKAEQIKQLSVAGYYYITAITKPQIESLLKSDLLQMSLFDEHVAEILDKEETRYILRRNPIRAQEIRASRASKLATITTKVNEANTYLEQHSRASAEKAQQRIQKHAERLKLRWVSIKLSSRNLTLAEDKTLLVETEKLDGCYVIKSNLPQVKADKDVIHARYKDLAFVEQAFRTSKTNHLELRPIFLRLAERTKAHALVVMLAYKIIRKLREAWQHLNLTVQEGISELSSLCLETIIINRETSYNSIPTPRDSIKQLLHALNITLPSVLPLAPNKRVSTNVKLQNRRNQQKN